MKLYRQVIELTYWDIEDSKTEPIIRTYKSPFLTFNTKGTKRVVDFLHKSTLLMASTENLDAENIYVTRIGEQCFDFNPWKCLCELVENWFDKFRGRLGR